MPKNKLNNPLGRGIESLLGDFDDDGKERGIENQEREEMPLADFSRKRAKVTRGPRKKKEDLPSVELLEEEVTEKKTRPKKNIDKKIPVISIDLSSIDEKRILEVPIGRVRPNSNQPRKNFEDEKLNELAASIESQGILQPIIVELIGHDEYMIIAGERRYRAAKLAKLERVPVVVAKLSETEKVEASLIENIQRADLNAIEEAIAYQNLISKAGYTQEELGLKLGKSRSSIANTLRLLLLPDEMKDDIISGALTPGHARAILSLVNPADKFLLRNKIIENELSVREAEALAESFNKGQKVVKNKKKKTTNPDIEQAEEKFKSAVQASCVIKGTLKKGKLVVKFNSMADLERLYRLLSSGAELFEE